MFSLINASELSTCTYLIAFSESLHKLRVKLSPLFKDASKEIFGEFVILKVDSVLLSNVRIEFSQPLTDVVTKDWYNGSLYITNYRVWFRPNDNAFYERKQCYSSIPLQTMIQKPFEQRDDTTKDKKYCLRFIDYNCKVAIIGFDQQQIMNSVQESIMKTKTIDWRFQ